VWANGVASHNTIIQAVFQFGFIGAPVLAYWVVCFYRSSARPEVKTKEYDLHRLIVFVGFFAPWLAIDMLFFDEFFLFQWYMIVALTQFSEQPEMEDIVENGLPQGRDRF
jgi:O-antigen ligase